MRWRRVAIAASLVLIVACGGGSNRVAGLVTAVDGDLTTVRSFTVVNGSDTYLFVPAPDGDYAFPLPHLRDHLRSGEPIIVAFRRDGDTLVAVSVDDG